MNLEKNFVNKNTYALGSEDSWFDFLGIPTNKGTDGEITYNICLKVISETLGKLPFKFYQKTENGKIQPPNNSAAYCLCQRPNEFYSPTVFWTAVEMNRLHHGNAYVYIQRELVPKKAGRKQLVEEKIVGLWLMPSNRVRIKVDTQGFFGGVGDIYYEYQDEYTNQFYIYPAQDVLHFKTSHTYNGIKGKPMREIIVDTLSGSLKSQNFMNKLYEDNLTASGYIESTFDVNDATLAKRASDFASKIKGGENIGRIGVLPPGLKFTPINIKPTDAQFFELRKYTSLQIAGCFGVKPTQINDYDKSSYNSGEQQNLAYYTDTILWIVKQYEEEINYKMLSRQELMDGYYFKMNYNVILRTDSKTQTENITRLINSGAYNINEARDMLDLPHVDGGDINAVNGTYIPVKDVGKQYGIGSDKKDEEE